MDSICGYHLAILRPRSDQIVGAYLFRMLQCNSIVLQLHTMANGITRYGLSQSAINNMLLPVPPLSEQVEIINFIKTRDLHILGLIDTAKKEIVLLQEYRTRLIADVVTGKLDVRAAAAALPAEGMDVMDLEEEAPELDELELDEEVLEEEEGV